jgi:3-dehydroquinate dehydratase-2
VLTSCRDHRAYGHLTGIRAKFPEISSQLVFMKKILVLHGPNLNLLGIREPSVYGHTNLTELNQTLVLQAKAAYFTLTSVQSNSESELIFSIHQAIQEKVDYIIFNPAAFTHTSIALRDALLAVNIPFIEVHLSNVHARESFRRHSYFSDIAQGVISGFGTYSYQLALQFVIKEFN